MVLNVLDTALLFLVSFSTLLLPWQSTEVIIVCRVGLLKVSFFKNLAIVYFCHSFYYVPVMV